MKFRGVRTLRAHEPPHIIDHVHEILAKAIFKKDFVFSFIGPRAKLTLSVCLELSIIRKIYEVFLPKVFEKIILRIFKTPLHHFVIFEQIVEHAIFHLSFAAIKLHHMPTHTCAPARVDSFSFFVLCGAIWNSCQFGEGCHECVCSCV